MVEVDVQHRPEQNQVLHVLYLADAQQVTCGAQLSGDCDHERMLGVLRRWLDFVHLYTSEIRLDPVQQVLLVDVPDDLCK